MKRILISIPCALTLTAPLVVWAQPQPGDLFSEYLWTNATGDAGGSLRVGGRLGYGVHFRITGDLSKAVAAQVVWVSWSPGYMEGRSSTINACLTAKAPVTPITSIACR